MGQGNSEELGDYSGKDNQQWLAAAILVGLILACLALVIIGAGQGMVIDGQRTQFRLVSAITNYPFCPPEIPCPISMVLDRNHWAVWILRVTHKPQGVETTYQKIIDIPLW